MLIRNLRGLLLCVLGAMTNAWGSPPPAPDELKYPNIIKPEAQFGTYGRELGQFNEPVAADFLADGSLLIADTHNHRIVHCTAAGDFIDLPPSGVPVVG